jgi:uncharacterized protein (DUF58 family)
MLTRYELLAISNNLTELGIKKIRRVGNHTEFEQIRDYVTGDDFRLINWKATARTSRLMVNVYQDERSQQVFSIIDKGRVMQQAFRGVTYLDYAINASLVLSYMAMRKEDKAGIVTFSSRFEDFVPASRYAGHMQNILEILYRQRGHRAHPLQLHRTDERSQQPSLSMQCSPRMEVQNRRSLQKRSRNLHSSYMSRSYHRDRGGERSLDGCSPTP